MGLDVVEIVMEVEDEFSIRITDQDASRIETLGQLCDCILEKQYALHALDCPTAAAFYRLRRSLASMFGLNEKDIGPETPLGPLFPLGNRRSLWARLERDLGLRLPPLTQPRWTCLCTLLGALLPGVLVYRWASDFEALLPSLLLGVVGSLVAFGVATLGFPSIERGYRTAGGLAKGLIAYNHAVFTTPPPAGPEGEEVWKRLCEIVSSQLAVDITLLRRETRFADLA